MLLFVLTFVLLFVLVEFTVELVVTVETVVVCENASTAPTKNSSANINFFMFTPGTVMFAWYEHNQSYQAAL